MFLSFGSQPNRSGLDPPLHETDPNSESGRSNSGQKPRSMSGQGTSPYLAFSPCLCHRMFFRLVAVVALSLATPFIHRKSMDLSCTSSTYSSLDQRTTMLGLGIFGEHLSPRIRIVSLTELSPFRLMSVLSGTSESATSWFALGLRTV